jgi:hypothetical protein
MTHQLPTPPDFAPAGAIFRTREDNLKVAYVPLTNGGYARVSVSDLDRLQAFGILCDDWYAAEGRAGEGLIVLAPSKNIGRLKFARVPDLIYGLGHFDQIEYRNGCPLDLTRSNVTRWHDKAAKDRYHQENAAKRSALGLPARPVALEVEAA